MTETSQFIAPHQVDRRRPTSGRHGSGAADPGQRSPLEVSHQPHTHLSGSASQVTEGFFFKEILFCVCVGCFILNHIMMIR